MTDGSPPHRVYPVEINPTGPFPLLIGLQGPPGSGKTMSALRLARGIQSVRPGPIRVIDTEAGRSAAYRADVEFGLVRLDPPYRPTRFLAAIHELIRLDAPACIIVDSLSDSWEGEGGVLEWHEEEINRRLGKDKDVWARREAMSMAAWIIPKADQNRLVGGMLRITTPIIVTYRAREKTRPVRDPQTGKTVPTKLGYVAIAPAEICHAMTAMCLLPPHAEGRPIWKSEEVGQDFLLKRPNYLAAMLTEAQLDEATGAALARWAQGSAAQSQATTGDTTATSGDTTPDGPALDAMLTEAAGRGYESFKTAWNGMTRSTDWRALGDDWRTYLRGRREFLTSVAREIDSKLKENTADAQSAAG